MGDRGGRPTLPIQNHDLVALTKKSIIDNVEAVDDDDPSADWALDGQPLVAMGSQPEAPPPSSRTATLADPLTTGLLAEVARRAETIELDPDTVEFAQSRNTAEINPEVLAAALRHAERTPVPSVDPPSNVIRKRTTTKK